MRGLTAQKSDASLRRDKKPHMRDPDARLLWFRDLAWWRPRTRRSHYPAFRVDYNGLRASQLGAAVPVGRDQRDDSGSGRPRPDDLASDTGQSVLADRHVRITDSGDRRPHSVDHTKRPVAPSLQSRDGSGDIPDAAPAGHRDPEPPASASRNWSRQILGDLLQTVGAEQSAQWATQLIDEFGGLQAVLTASPEASVRIVGNEGIAAYLQLLGNCFEQALRLEAFDGPIMSSSQAVIDYFTTSMAHTEVEEVRILFLNTRNQLIREETVSRGSVSEASITPREVIRRALELRATALIMVHNHPSGDPRPSPSDRCITRDIEASAKLFQIIVHDHLIVGRAGWVSFRQEGWLS